MVNKIKPVVEVKKVRKIGKRHLTIKGLYYRQLMRKMFSNRITIEKGSTSGEHEVGDQHILDRFV